MKVNKLYNLDCREGLQKLEDNSIDCVVTSPPYWALRDYGVEEQIGLESTFEEYIKELCDIFDIVKQKLKKSGTCWVNLGDTYGSHKSNESKLGEKHNNCVQERKPIKGFVKCLCMIPQRFAIEMINRGWILRNVIIWYKPNCMPSSAKDRFTVDFEYVYFFVKNKKYYFEQQFEPLESEFIYSRNSKKGGVQEKNNPRANWKEGLTKEEYINHIHDHGNTSLKGRNKRCVWKVNTKANSLTHFATFNSELITPMIKAGCPKYICKKCGKPRIKIYNEDRIATRPGDNVGNAKSGKESDPNSSLHNSELSKYRQQIIRNTSGYTDCNCNMGFDSGIVLDPFAGIGTTLYTAWNLGRNYIGFELNKEYCELAEMHYLSKTKYKRLEEY